MTATGRLLLYVMTGVAGPVLAAKQLYAGCDFQGSDMPESAYSVEKLNSDGNMINSD